VDYDPKAPQADVYRKVAGKIVNNTEFTIPSPITIDELESLMREFGISD